MPDEGPTYIYVRTWCINWLGFSNRDYDTIIGLLNPEISINPRGLIAYFGSTGIFQSFVK